ncbi:MAG: TfoX/Sxy family protein [Eubacterium sp.]
MSSNPEFVQYIADQLSESGNITYRKMFGEYGMYCDGKIFALICDNQLFIKITEKGKQTAPDLKTQTVCFLKDLSLYPTKQY